MLVLGVFAGGRENVITGAALIALAFGMLMLVELARRRTDQPQSGGRGQFVALALGQRLDHDLGVAEFAELPTVFRQDKALTSLGGKPLFVLTADIGEQSGWPAAQNKLAALSTNSVHQTTHGATHVALVEDRNYAAVSSRAIGAVVRSVRTGNPLVR